MRSIRIGNFVVSKKDPIFIIAEIGVNHNGSLELALELINKAKLAGADCVKFQTFKADQVATKNAPKAKYQMLNTSVAESQVDMLRKYELPIESYSNIIEYCKKQNVTFLSTPYSFDDVDFLEELKVPGFKIASGQIIEWALLKYIASKNKPIILSTGMASLAEVDDAVNTILSTGNKELILLQCTTNYPSRPEDANLLAMVTMENSFNTLVGYSDHTQNSTASIVAVGLGATVIEKHITLNRSLPGPDHSSSLEPQEFKDFVKIIREAELVRGTGLKQPCEIERDNSCNMRRSIVARTNIHTGEVITLEKVTFKRPSNGIRPSFLDHIIGRKAIRDILVDEMLDWDDLRK